MEQENPYYQPQAPPPIPGAPPPMPMQIAVAHGHYPPTTADDRSMAMLCHLLSILTGFIGPLILWLVKKDTSPFVNHHGREALNFQITAFLISMAAAIVIFALMIIVVGFFLAPLLIVLPILFLIAEIMACMAANRGEWHRYPCCIRIL